MIAHPYFIVVESGESFREVRDNYYCRCRKRGIPSVILTIEKYRCRIDWDCNPMFEYDSSRSEYFTTHEQEIADQIRAISLNARRTEGLIPWAGTLYTRLGGGEAMAVKLYAILDNAK